MSDFYDQILDSGNPSPAPAPAPEPSPIVAQPAPAGQLNPTPPDVSQAMQNHNFIAPDEAVKIHQIAKDFDVPFELALSQKDVFKKQHEALSIASSLGQQTPDGKLAFPGTTDFLNDPVQFSKSRDDIQGLQNIENAVRGPAPKPVARDYLDAILDNNPQVIAERSPNIERKGFIENLTGAASDTAKARDFGLFIAGNPTDDDAIIQKAIAARNEGQGVSQGGAANFVGSTIGGSVEPIGAGLVGSLATPATGLVLAGGDMVSSGAGSAYQRVFNDQLDKGVDPKVAHVAAMKAAGFGAAVNAALAAVLPGSSKVASTVAGLKEGLAPTLGQAVKYIATDTAVQAGAGATANVATNAYEGRDLGEGTAEAIAGQALFSVLHIPMLIDAARTGKVPETIKPIAQKISKSAELMQDIQSRDAEIASLQNIKDVSDQSKTVKRDPEAAGQFISKTLADSNQPETMQVSAKALTDVFFQNETNVPEVVSTGDQAAQADVTGRVADLNELDRKTRDLNQFAKDVGLDPQTLNDAIKSGGYVEINKGALVSKYGNHPVFDAVVNDYKKGIDESRSDLQTYVGQAKAELEKFQSDNQLPAQLRDIRSKLLLPKDEGGAGFSALKADHYLNTYAMGLKIAADERGQTLEEHLKQNPVEFRVGGEGKAFVQELGKPLFQEPTQNVPQFDYTETHTKPGREALRSSIVNDIVSKAKPVAEGKEKVLVLAGGGTASGKTSVLDSIRAKSPSFGEGAAHIDSDSIKSFLPEYQAMVKAKDKRAAEVVHEESSNIAKKAVSDAMAKKANIIYDATLSNFDSADKIIKEARKNGYKVQLVGVTTDFKNALARIEERYRTTGRYVATDKAAASHIGFSKNFEKYIPLVDRADLYNTDQKEAARIASKVNNQLDVIDKNAYSNFRKVGQNEKLGQSEPSGKSEKQNSNQGRSVPGDAGSNLERGNGSSSLQNDVGRVAGSEKGQVETQSGLTPERKALAKDFKDDLAKQTAWIDQQSKGLGFKGLEDLAQKDPQKYDQLASEWRAKNSRFNAEGQQLFQGDGNTPKGAFYFDPSGTAVIHLFNTADASTFLHEAAGHHLFELMKNLVDSGKASEQTGKDYKTLLDYVGSTDGNLDVSQREKIARAFETYFMEGKAPSIELTDAFSKFKDWLVKIYKSVVNLNAPINDKVREVFDRRLASESDIAEARQYYGMNEDVTNLLTKDEAKRQELKQNRTRVEQEQNNVASAEALSALEKAEESRAEFKKAAIEQTDKDPFYVAMKNSEKEKISISDLRETLGEKGAEAVLKKFPDSFSEKGTTSISSIAAEHGFDSVDRFVNQLESAPDRETIIKQRTDWNVGVKEQELKRAQQESDVTPNDSVTHVAGSMGQLVDEAQALADEIAKNKAGRKQRIIEKVYRDAARDQIADKKVAEAGRYDLFAKAEKRYAKEVVQFLLRGKTEKALESRKKQLLNHALVQEAIKVREEWRKIDARYAPKKLASTLKNVESSYMEPIVELLARYGLKPRDPSKPVYDIARIKDLDEVLYGQLPDWIRNGEKQGDFKQTLTFDELRDLDQAVQSVAHFGRDELLSIKEKDLATKTEFVNNSLDRLNQLTKKTVLDANNKLRPAQKVFDKLIAATFQPRFQFDVADNYTHRTKGAIGPMLKMLSRINGSEIEAIEKKHVLLKEITPFVDLVSEASQRIAKENGKAFKPEQLGLPGDSPIFEELRKAGRPKLTPENLASIMLNSGNADGLRVLENAYGFKAEHVAKIANLYTEEELKAFQGIWKSINTLYPELKDTHFRIYNRDIGKVEGVKSNYFSKDGKNVELEGGYYPLKFDSEINPRAEEIKEEDIMKQVGSVIRTTKPEDGFVKGRVGGHSLPPRLSLDVLSKHLEDVTRYITHAEVLRDMNRITKDDEWRRNFEDKMGKDQYKALRNWLQDLAQPDRNPTQNSFVQWINDKSEAARRLATYAALGFKPKNAVLQRTNIINAAHEIGWKWILKGFNEAGINGTTILGTKGSKAYDFMTTASKEMKHRETTIDREMRDAMNGMKLGQKSLKLLGTKFTVQDLRDASFFLLQMNDRAINTPIWMGSYLKHLELFADKTKSHEAQVKEAIGYADSIIQKVQPGSFKAELNAMQREKGFVKLITSFMSWGARYGSRLTFEGKAWREGRITNAQYFSHLAHEVFAEPWTRLLFAGVIGGSLPSAWQFLTEPLNNLISWIPVAKDIPRVVTAKNGKVSFDPEKAVPAFEGGKRLVNVANTSLGVYDDRKDVGDLLWDVGRYTEYRLGIPALNVVNELKNLYKNLTADDDGKK